MEGGRGQAGIGGIKLWQGEKEEEKKMNCQMSGVFSDYILSMV